MNEKKGDFFDAKSTIKSNLMYNLRTNTHNIAKDMGITVAVLSEMSGLPERTLKNVLYGNNEDCKFSNAVAIAKALGVSIDELADCGTINEISLQNMIDCRSLPPRYLNLVRWFIRHQITLSKNDKEFEKIISVMEAKVTSDYTLKVSNIFKQIDLSDVNISEEIKQKSFLGIHLPTEHFLPYYSMYDVILIADDRKPLERERVAVLIKDSLFLVENRYINGEQCLFGIRDGKYRQKASEVDEVIGYVSAVIPDTSIDGNR